MLVVGVWPLLGLVLRQRAVDDLVAAVYGGRPGSARFELASKALDKLTDLSLVGLDKGGFSLIAHDLIVNVA